MCNSISYASMGSSFLQGTNVHIGIPGKPSARIDKKRHVALPQAILHLSRIHTLFKQIW